MNARAALDLAIATTTVAASAAGTAWLCALPLRAGPFSTWALLYLLVFVLTCMIGVTASTPVLRRAARRRTRESSR